MGTKKGWIGSLSIFLFAAALVFGVSLAEPEEACAGDCEEDWLTANGWGMGATCAAAKNACFGDAYDAAEADCNSINKDLCQTGSITYTSCYPSGGQIKVDCYLQYKCEGGPEFPEW